MKSKILKKGDLIISYANNLRYSNFNRTVTLLTEHNLNESFGFVLNKKLNIRIKDIIPNIECNFNVYHGGPVDPENLYFIHNVPEIITNSIEISNGIFWGGHFKNIINLLNENKLKKTNIRFFLGYTNWDSNQLTFEIETNSSLIKDNIYKNQILRKAPSNLWKELIKTFGNKKIIWCNTPENPILN